MELSERRVSVLNEFLIQSYFLNKLCAFICMETDAKAAASCGYKSDYQCGSCYGNMINRDV